MQRRDQLRSNRLRGACGEATLRVGCRVSSARVTEHQPALFPKPLPGPEVLDSKETVRLSNY